MPMVGRIYSRNSRKYIVHDLQSCDIQHMYLNYRDNSSLVFIRLLRSL